MKSTYSFLARGMVWVGECQAALKEEGPGKMGFFGGRNFCDSGLIHLWGVVP